MKTFLLLTGCLVFPLSPVLHAADAKPMPKEVAALLADYQKEYTKAKEPADKVLRQEASKVAAKLVGEGHAEEAKLIGSQVEDKVAGKPVADVHSQLTTLFGQYDSAVTNATRPIREKYGRRVDALLQSFAGKDMAAVIAVGEAKRVVDGVAESPLRTQNSGADKLPSSPNTASKSAQVSTGSFKPTPTKLDPTGRQWLWGARFNNTMEFRADGTCAINWGDSQSIVDWVLDADNQLVLTSKGKPKGRVTFEDSTMRKGTYVNSGSTPATESPIKLKE